MAEMRPMVRCECQKVAFESVLDHALRRDQWELETLCAQVGCGQICTACRGDLASFLDQRCPLRELRERIDANRIAAAAQAAEADAEPKVAA